PADVNETDTTDNAAIDIDTLTPTVELSITKTDGVSTAVPGASTTYTIVVTNSGPSDVTGASVVDTFDATKFTKVTFTAAGTGGANGFSNSPTTGVNNIN